MDALSNNIFHLSGEGRGRQDNFIAVTTREFRLTPKMIDFSES